MSKIPLTFLATLMLSLALSCGQKSNDPEPKKAEPLATGTQTLIPVPETDPISKAFEKAQADSQNTAEINFVADEYLKAWKDESAHAATLVKDLLKQKADKDKIDSLLAQYVSLAKLSADLDVLAWLDTDLAPGKERDESMGTGADAASSYGAAAVYRNATDNLSSLYEALSQGKKYEYGYKGSGPDLEKMRAEN